MSQGPPYISFIKNFTPIVIRVVGVHATELNINAKVYGRQQRLHERTFTSNSSPWCCVQICLQHAKTLCCCWLCCLVGMCNMSMGKRDFLYFYVVWRLSKQKLSTYNHTTLCRQLKIFIGFTLIKCQLISKADWRDIVSPRKQTDEFVLFAFLLFTANKSNSSVRFLEESAARPSTF